MDLKDWVKAARKHKGWTQLELGEAIGRGKANVGHWENGKHLPPIKMLARISEETGYPLPDLGGVPPTPPAPKSEPPAPPPRFADNHMLTPEQWEQFQAFSIAATSDEKKAIIERYESLKKIAAQVYGVNQGEKK
jgi:transcriptional regulator with XRE-family HTH domain